MASKSMAAVVKTLLEEVRQNDGLRSLLVKTGNEEERPRLRINGQTYMVGLVDDNPMLLRESDRVFFDPGLVGDGVTEIVWKLK